MPKTLPLVLLLIPFCISCNRYQYATINSHQLDKNDRNEFVFGLTANGRSNSYAPIHVDPCSNVVGSDATSEPY